MFMLLLVLLELFGFIGECSDYKLWPGFGPLDLGDLGFRNLVLHPDSFRVSVVSFICNNFNAVPCYCEHAY